MFVVGTAGHVDHGKSTLVKALTGIDPDRLREERERAMTIDLGFAWLSLPDGQQVSVVDVPGHERFIKNMLAGVGGLDAALLIIAADEGPMPQTAEHLAILDLLGIEHGLVVLTKADLVDDDWLALVTEEVRERLQGTTLAAAPLVPVSATTGKGLDELRQALGAVLATTPARSVTGPPRLPIDRVFTISGFGTVVTGTLSDGPLVVGQEVEIVPAGHRGRIRGLQSHRAKVTESTPGARVAVNLAGLAVEDIRRGEVLTLPGVLIPTDRIDAQIRLLPAAGLELEQNDLLDCFVGAAEVPAQVTLLDAQRLQPGATGWVQLRLRRPLAVVKGERFILRRASPSQTIGGGVVIDPHPRRHKRFQETTLAALATLAKGAPTELVLQALAEAPCDRKTLLAQTHLDAGQLQTAMTELQAAASILLLHGDLATPKLGDVVASTANWATIVGRLTQLVRTYHASFPLRVGISKEEVKQRLALTPRLFDAVIATALRQGLLVDAGPVFRLPDQQITLTPVQQAQADRYLAALQAQPFAPPAPAEFGLEPELVLALAALGRLRRIDESIAFATTAYEQILAETLQILATEGAITVARFRDHFGSSRKYALVVLEHFDRLQLTRRVGDERVRGPAALERVAGTGPIASDV